jgi:TPR repeat protein
MLERASNAGSGAAGYYLGRMYRDGLGVKSDDAKALDFAQRGAYRGNRLRRTCSATSCWRGAERSRMTRRRSAGTCAPPTTAIRGPRTTPGYMLESGRGLKSPDITRAITYYLRAIDDGVPPAGNALANLYRNGKGVQRTSTRRFAGIDGLRSAAIRTPRCRSATCTRPGRGARTTTCAHSSSTGARRSRTTRWALNNVGYFYEFGRAVPMNLNEAAVWYSARRAARRSHCARRTSAACRRSCATCSPRRAADPVSRPEAGCPARGPGW